MYTSREATPGSTVYFWFPSGVDTSQPVVPPGWNIRCPSDYTIGNWHWQWAWKVTIPLTAAPGTYNIGDKEIVVRNNIVTTRPRKTQLIQPGLSLFDAQNAVNIGRDLILKPGLHVWKGSLNVLNNTKISGYHATILRMPNGEYAERMFIPKGTMFLEGLTLTHECDWPTYIHNYLDPPTSTLSGQITVKNCTLKGGELIRCFQSRNMLVQNCRFEKASTGQVPSLSVWDHCDFVGHTANGMHAFFNTGAEGILVTNCTWYGTNRGIVFQTGSCRGSMIMNCYFDNIRGGEANANEVILFEGNGVPGEGIRENTLVDINITNCAGPGICLFGSGFTDNRFWSINAEVDNTALMIAAINGQIDNNSFENFQTTGGIDLRGPIGKVKFGNLQIYERPQMSGNQGPFTPILEHFNQNYPLHKDNVTGEITFYGSNFWRSNRTKEPING